MNVLHGNVEHALLLAGIVNGDNIGMVQETSSPGLVLEPPEHVLGFQAMDIEPHGLEGDGASNGRIERLVHKAHGATSKFFDNFVSCNFLEGHEGPVL